MREGGGEGMNLRNITMLGSPFSHVFPAVVFPSS